ncbi:hypothetical protein [Clostridium aciditolerans]|uniref:Uncharacterized protein n=1 Tax=Clostridium aciditolerans TaxID=339861 RepID=A0A934HWQ5_9CLOT|nr:hypothetical protein [Clostridium aciditolerans]MBI6872183.1 hypothetical protein [Clostridium aciditolerans]
MDLEQLNILGAQLTFLGDGLLVLAAEKEASLDQIKDKKEKEEQSQLATNLNTCGNFIVLLGDTISALVVQQESEKTFQNEKETDPITLEATRENLIGAWLRVISDVFSYRAAVLIASVR